MLTGTQLKQIATRLSSENANKFARIIGILCNKYGITSVDVLHEFLANVLHESGEFSIKSENMRYTSPARLIAVWPSRFTLSNEPRKLNAALYVNDAVKLANEVYGSRMGNNPKTNDGFNFRGGGFAQITGRDAYVLYTIYINKRDNTKLTIQEVARQVMTVDEWAMDSAFWFFCIFKNLEQLALQDNFKELVKRWNGGFVGIADREKYYTLCKKILI